MSDFKDGKVVITARSLGRGSWVVRAECAEDITEMAVLDPHGNVFSGDIVIDDEFIARLTDVHRAACDHCAPWRSQLA